MKKEALRVQVILKNLKKQLVLKRKENENYRRMCEVRYCPLIKHKYARKKKNGMMIN